MILPVTLILAYFALSIHSKKLHEHMTKEEIESIFNVKHDYIHEVDYDVVPIFHAVNTTQQDRVKRSYGGSELRDVYMKHNGHEYFLYLVNNKVLVGTNTPIYIAKFDRLSKRIYYTSKKYKDYFPESFGMYHDYENQASFFVQTDAANNNRHFDGIIGKSIQIRSIPDRLHSELKRNYSALLETLPDLSDLPRNLTMDDSTYHIIINKNNNTMDDTTNSNDNNNSNNNNNNDDDNNYILGQKNMHDQSHEKLKSDSTPSSKSWFGTNQAGFESLEFPFDRTNIYRKWDGLVSQPEKKIRQPPYTYENREDTVYPEIMVAVDYETFELHGKDIKTVAKYMAAFWNAVDLRYREFKDPEVRLNIAGLIIAEDASSAPYITDSPNNYGHYCMADPILRDVNRYFADNLRNKFSLDSYDVLVAMITKKMADYDENGKFDDQINGIAYEKGACNYLRYAIVKDLGGFDGIKPAAHELGHLFGTGHDKKTYDDCDYDKGFMMSYKLNYHTLFRWSRCSKAAIKTFLKSGSSYCLKNKPNVGGLYPEILPGTLQSRDKQCLAFYGTYAVNVEEALSDCVQLWCYDPLSTNIRSVTPGPPVEGTPCGQNRICLDGYCVDDSPAYHSRSTAWSQ